MGRLGSFTLVWQLVKEKEMSEFKPVKLHKKIDHMSHPTHMEGLVNTYIYIVIHGQICFVLSELSSVAWWARFPKLGSKPGWLKCQSKILPLSYDEASASEVNLNSYESQLLLFTYFRLTATDSYKEPCIYANGNTITSFAREPNPRGVGECIYIVIHRQICFVLSELISVARRARFSKLGLKTGWLKRQLKILPLSHKEARASEVNSNGYESQLLLFAYFCLMATESSIHTKSLAYMLMATQLLHSLESSTLLG